MSSQPGSGPGPEHWSAISKSLAQLAKQHEESPAAAQVSVGLGLPAITKKLLQKIRANEYVDFGELPPAKGKTKSVPQSLEGQVIVIQAAELYKQRKIIPDLATWVQCFALYATVILAQEPERRADLMAYASIIAKASQKYRWPSWIVYDQNFRQEAADMQNKQWAKVDPSIYAQCFTGMALRAEAWCRYCHVLDHTSEDCPGRQMQSLPMKRPFPTPATPAKKVPGGSKICNNFNRFDGNCRFKNCRYQHVCMLCGLPHPATRCSSAKMDIPTAATPGKTGSGVSPS